MKTKLLILFLFILVFTTSIPSTSAKADVGPSSSLSFVFQIPTDADDLHISNGILFVCIDKSCNKQEYFDGYFSCGKDTCFARPDGSSEYSDYNYYKLSIEFSDGTTFESNIFQSKTYNSHYMIYLKNQELIVKEKVTIGSFLNIWAVISFIFALLLTIPTEVIISFFLSSFWKIEKIIIKYIVYANLLSLVILYFVLSFFIRGNYFLVTGEVFVTLFEAFFLYHICKNKIPLSITQSLGFSVIMNLASYFIGWLLLVKSAG